MGDDLNIDEVEISGGELYTVVTNKEQHGKQGCLVAIVQGTKVEIVIKAISRIPLQQREEAHQMRRPWKFSYMRTCDILCRLHPSLTVVRHCSANIFRGKLKFCHTCG